MKQLLLPLTYLVSNFISIAQVPDDNVIGLAKNINAESAKQHLSVLASDEYEGRETGKAGQKKAAAYIASYFKSIGLESATDETYFQKFPLTLRSSENPVLSVNRKTLGLYKDYYLFPSSSTSELNAKNILFLGYGISDEKYDDYKNVDVRGKVLLVLDGEPLSADSVSLISGTKESSRWGKPSRLKSETAKNNGAAAIFFISSKFDMAVRMVKHFSESPMMKLDSPEAVAEKDLFVGGFSANAGNEILLLVRGNEKRTVEQLKKEIYEKKTPVSFNIKTRFSLTAKNVMEKISSENVLGVIKGSEFPNEYIFLSAHYDHIGIMNGKVFNGADDDGSGTVGIMEIAKAFMKAKEAGLGPKRSIVFLSVSGEEKGLLGSSYYVDHPIFSLANTVCDLNIDMIGRIDEAHKTDSSFVYIIGSDKISTDLHKINEQANSTYTRLKLDYTYNNDSDPNRFYYRSDHYNFAKKGIPIIFYFNGVHEDYHKESDEISKIDFNLLVKRTQLVFYTAWEIANRKERIKADAPLEK